MTSSAMKLDHRIKIKILDGIDSEFVVGIQIKESGSVEKLEATKRNSIRHRMSIFSRREEENPQTAPASNFGSTLKPQDVQKRGSIFQKRLSIFRRGSDESPFSASSSLDSRRSSIAARRPSIVSRSQSISHVTRPSFVVGNNFINVVSSVELKNNNIGQEYEFNLSDSFHSIFLFLYKKKLGSTQLLADIELPAIVLDPDEIWHEQTLALKDETYTDKQGHQFMISSITAPIPCYHCNTVMYSDSSMPELEFFKCDGCGILCHGSCHSFILSTCSKVLRLKIGYCYIKEPIYVSFLINMKDTAKYKPLLDGLFNGNTGLLDLFSRVCDNLDEVSLHIVKVLETFPKRKALEVISDLCITEMSQADYYRNIFQQPSLALKVTELFMNHIAKDFLIFVLQKSIAQIIQDDFDCELDSSRISAEPRSTHISEKLSRLENYLEQLFRAITTSPKSCPFPLRCILANIYGVANKLYPEEPTAGYVVANNILFRKFFIPALMGPESFGIPVSPFHTRSQRTITTLCKVLQRISNLDFFESTADLNFQKMNRIISSYHPIISIYMNELTKVSMIPKESPDLNKERAVKETKIIKIPWYQKLFPFCFPNKNMAMSTSDLDLFKEKPQQNLDWEDLDTPFEEIISKSIDPDIHIAALGRLLLRYGDKLILSCLNDKETSLAYEGLGWASSLIGKQRQQMDEVRKRAILRIQQEYQSQFYTEDVESYDMSNAPENNTENIMPSESSDAVPKIIETQSIDAQMPKIESRSSSMKNRTARKQSNYSGTSTSLNSIPSLPDSMIKGESGFLRSFILSIDSVDGPVNPEMDPDEREYLETPIIGMTIQEESSKVEESTDLLSVNFVDFGNRKSVSPPRNNDYSGLPNSSTLIQKRKSLMMNLDSILRPNEETEKSSGSASSLDSPNMQHLTPKQRVYSNLIPKSKTVTREDPGN